MKYLILVFFLITSFYANCRDMKWSKGSCVLASGQVVIGVLSVDDRHNLVLFRLTKSRTEVLPARSVREVHFYDSAENINRRFVSVATVHSSLEQYFLYEVVVNGDIQVLRSRKSYPILTSISDRDDFEYYLYFQGERYHLRQFRTMVFPKLGNGNGDFKTILRKENLNPNFPAHAIAIAILYNRSNSVPQITKE